MALRNTSNEERKAAPSRGEMCGGEHTSPEFNRASRDALLAVVYKPIASLIFNPRNSRTHSKQQIRKLKASIESFKFTNPVLISEDNTIIAGHGRVQAAKLLKMTEVPTICLPGLTPDEIRAYMIADNRVALDAGWDTDILKAELLRLDSLPDLDISLTGFEIPEIDLIMTEKVRADDPVDRLPALERTAITKSGDLWILGEHRIFCGDAREHASYASLLGNNRAAMVFSDPPYNVAIDGHVTHGNVHKHPEFAMASGEMTEGEFIEFLLAVLGQLAKWSTDGSVHFICMDWRHVSELMQASRQVYTSMLNLCVWSKDNGGMGSFYRSQHELVFVFKAGTAPHRNNIMLGKFGRNRSNIWQYPCANTASRGGDEGNLLAMHPTVKPVALVADAILDCSARGEIVLDAFLGSGSTLLACERTRRICYGMEIEGRYVDLAIRRWQQLTGERAQCASTNEYFPMEG